MLLGRPTKLTGMDGCFTEIVFLYCYIIEP